MEEILSNFELKENTAKLVSEIIREKLELKRSESIEQRHQLIAKIKKSDERLKNAQTLFLDGDLEKEVYHEMRENLKNELVVLNRKLNETENFQELSRKEINQCMSFFQNIGKLYREGDTGMKQTILSSMFPEKLIFSENK